jgi:3-isopropylmalate/(R)-2-methylmalate dehydratase small subunit
VTLPAEVAAGLRETLRARPGAALTVDLETQTITGPDGRAIAFEIDAFRKQGLLSGQDEMEMTLARLPAIEAFEARRRDEMPWLA